MPPLIADLFAGPGGWDLGAAALGLRLHGIEYDPTVCLTRRAAGWETLHADVGAVDPRRFTLRPALSTLAVEAGLPAVYGLIGSPPCPLWSQAGSKAGWGVADIITAAIGPVLAGEPDAVGHARQAAYEALRGEPEDDGSMLALLGLPSDADLAASNTAYEASMVLEPARWVAALRPRWVALEQVTAVAPLWAEMAAGLARLGYSAWSGILTATDYGVPQKRRRAILIASLDREVGEPPRTHGGEGQPEHVSMRRALGWDGDVGFPRLDDRGDSPDGYRERDWFSADGPAPTLTEKARSWVLRPGTPYSELGPDGSNGHRRLHDLDEPAPSLVFGHDSAGWQWVPPDHLNTGRDWKEGGTRADAQTITVDAPAPTITGVPGQALWQWDDETDVPAGAKRVTEDEAAVLQTFPVGYPWQGGRSARFSQIGDAVPPLLAHHVLAEATGLPPQEHR
jgi:DNA (cytosine-5)-methyltransferase 1